MPYPELTTVPRDLYYVERAFVTRQAGEIERLRAVLEYIMNECDPRAAGIARTALAASEPMAVTATQREEIR